MPDCRVEPAAPSDPKFSMLAELLEIARPHAFGLAVSIWCLCWRKEYFDGRLRRWTAAALCEEIYWKGDIKRLIEALVKSEVLTRDPDGTYVAKNFTERQGPLIKKLLRERGPVQTENPTPPPVAAPPAAEPSDEVVRQVLQQMRLSKIPGSPQQKREHVEAWRARGINGGDILAVVTNNPGKGVFELEKLLTKGSAAGGSGLPTTVQELTRWAKEGDARDAAANKGMVKK